MLRALLFTRDAVALGLPECLQLLSDRAQTAPGRALCLTPRLYATAAECREAYSAVSEAFAVETSPPFPHALAIEDGLIAVSEGATLGAQDLLEIGQAVAALHVTACWAEPHRWERTPQLAALATNASPPPRLLKAFGDAFDRTSTGEVVLSSKAFPRLARRRVSAQSAARSTADTMRSLLTEPDFVAGLAEDRPQPRQRDGRWVVPVAVGSGQARVGKEVARSRSGATAFVEPHRLRRLSAAAARADGRVESAERRLLRALNALVAAHRAPLEESLAAAAQLDAVAARAALGTAWGARVPAVGEQGVVRLDGATHPLLAGAATAAATAAATGGGVPAAVGNRLELGGEGCPQGLVLTGPNGGGKSVVLKTVGLAALLVRCAVPVPCAPALEGGGVEGGGGGDGMATAVASPRVDFFSEVVSDLAEAQDVAAGTSSYSAHVRCCARALAAADAHGARALVLLDEPGASTEPAEGAAVAQAVVEELLARGARLVATTHASPLKLLALRDQRLQVAAMQRRRVDAGDGGGAAMLPTYTMLVGAVGDSYALDAAAREGLPEALLARARGLLPDDDAEGDGDADTDGDGDAAGGGGSGRGGRGGSGRSHAALSEALEQSCEEAAAAAAAARAALAEAEAARREARGAAARGAAALEASRRWLAARRVRLDGLVERLRAQGADELELLGQTLEALSLLEVDAAEARARALATLGLRALGGRPLRAGESLVVVATAAAAAQPSSTIEAEVAEDAPEGSADAQMSIVGGPPVRVPRAELAEWAAVDAAIGADGGSFSADGWDWMGAVAPMAEQSRSNGGGKRKRRR